MPGTKCFGRTPWTRRAVIVSGYSVDAGVDQASFHGAPAALTAVPSGTTTSYAWVETSSNSTTVVSPLSAETLVTDLPIGLTSTFSVTAHGASLEQATDTVSVTPTDYVVPATPVQLVVVIGSSTAVGAPGPSDLDHSWSNILNAYLQAHSPGSGVYNLARISAAATTSQLLVGAGSVPAALLVPGVTAIVVCCSGNDQAMGVDPATTQANLAAVEAACAAAGVQLFMTTTYPRRDPSLVASLTSTREWVLANASNPIEFWDGFVDQDNLMLPAFDPGDHVHENNAGHRKMATRVINALLPAFVMSGTHVPSPGSVAFTVPAPGTGVTSLAFWLDLPAPTQAVYIGPGDGSDGDLQGSIRYNGVFDRWLWTWNYNSVWCPLWDTLPGKVFVCIQLSTTGATIYWRKEHERGLSRESVVWACASTALSASLRDIGGMLEYVGIVERALTEPEMLTLSRAEFEPFPMYEFWQLKGNVATSTHGHVATLTGTSRSRGIAPVGPALPPDARYSTLVGSPGGRSRDSLNSPSAVIRSAANVSVEFWFQWEDITTNVGVNDGPNSYAVVLAPVWGTNPIALVVQYDHGAGRYQLNITGWGAQDYCIHVNSVPDTSCDGWNFCAFTFARSGTGASATTTIQCFTAMNEGDVALASSSLNTTAAGEIVSDNSRVFVGQAIDAGAAISICDLKIFESVRTLQQIQSSYKSSAPDSTARAHYPLRSCQVENVAGTNAPALTEGRGDVYVGAAVPTSIVVA